MEPNFTVKAQYTQQDLICATRILRKKPIWTLRVLFSLLDVLLLYELVKIFRLFPRAAAAGYATTYLALVLLYVVVLAGSIWFMIRFVPISVKRSIKRSGAVLLAPRTISFFEDEYQSRSERQETRMLYERVSEAVETETDFYLVSDGLTILLPKAGLSGGTTEEFRRFLQSKLPASAVRRLS